MTSSYYFSSSTAATPLFAASAAGQQQQPFAPYRTASYSSAAAASDHPFTSFLRRRRRSGASNRSLSSWIPTLLRGVLLSPLLVLVVYVAVLRRATPASPRAVTSPAAAKTYYDHGQRKTEAEGCSRTQTYYEHGALKRDACKQQVQQLPMAQQQPVAQLALQQQQQPQAAVGDSYEAPHAVIPIAVPSVGDGQPPPPLGSTGGDGAALLLPWEASASGPSASSQSATIVRPRPQPKRMVSNYYAPILEEAQPQQRIVVQPSALSAAAYSSEAAPEPPLTYQLSPDAVADASPPLVGRPPIPLRTEAQPLAGAVVDPPPSAQEEAPLLLLGQQQPAPPQSGRSPPRHQAAAATTTTTVAYYYYDPRDVRIDARGRSVLPDVVYDSHGRPHPLASLRARQGLAVEPPPSPPLRASLAATPAAALAASANPPVARGYANATSSAAAAAAAAAAALPQWGESAATDQSIIVSTVGLMALLVGAVSARRFRRQSILSACIENETLDDCAPYVFGGSNSNHYRTFDDGWKGDDLEKFDV